MLLIGGLVFAGLVATLAVGVFVPKGDGGKRGRGKKVMVWFLVGASTFFLWGSSSGEGGPVPGGGTTGYTYCGILHYMTVSSRQAGRGAPWMHDLHLHPWPLVGTVAPTEAACIVIAVVTRWSRRIA